MKRALSLIIVLAMVLCMVPFSAFAADGVFGFGGPWEDGTIILSEDNGFGLTYLWTASEAGTLVITATSAVEGTGIYILVDGEEYDGSEIEVNEGDQLEITIADGNEVGGEVTVSADLTGLPGTESNPKVLAYPLTPMYPNPTTDAIEPGVTEYYVLQGYGNQEVVISGLGVKVVTVADGAVYGGEATTESVTFTVPAGQMYYVLKITNKAEAAQTYTVSTVVKVGTMDNPEVVEAGEYDVDIEAGAEQPYYYKYIAEGDGTVTVGVAASTVVVDAESGEESVVDLGWQYVVNNLTAGSYGDTHWSDDDPVVNPETITVSEGDEIVIMAGTYDPDPTVWALPAGTVTTTIAFEAASEEPEDSAIVIEALPYTAEHTGVYDQDYTYTATEAGYLYVASEGWMSVNCGNTWAEGYGDGYVLAMNEGDVANINLYAYWGEETFTYEFTWLTEITPDGSYGYPLEVGTLLNGEVTLVNDGEDAIYYTYTAEKNGEIYNSFYEEANAVAEGETVMFYVPAGGITIYYMPAVAMIGEAEYTTIDAAVAAAVSGDTITLVANVTAEAGIVLPAGAKLDLGEYSLEAPYVVAFSGSDVIGVVGSATITAANLVAGNVTISDVEYAWTATDGVYSLVEVAAETVADPVAKIGDVMYASVEEALNAAVSGETVTMIADDLDNADAILIIKGGVTLNLVAFDLKAAYVIGLTDSVVTGSRLSASNDYAKLYVDSGNISISNDTVYTQTASNGVDYHLITMKMGDYYVFTHTQLYDSETEATGYGFTSDKEAGTAKITFYFNLPSVAKTPIANDGATAHGVSFIVEASWVTPTDNGDMYQSMTFTCSEELAKALASGSKLACPIEDCNNYQDLKLTTKLLTDTGAVVVGEEYTY